MKIQLTCRHFEPTDAMKQSVQDRLQALKFTEHLHDLHVTMEVERHRQIVELVAYGDGFTLKTADETSDMYLSVDGAGAKLEKQLKKHHDHFLANRTKVQKAREHEKADIANIEVE